MKTLINIRLASIVMLTLLIGLSAQGYEDIEFSGGVTAKIDYLVDGSVFIYDANVVMVDPAHITGYVITGSEAVFDVWGGKIDVMSRSSVTVRFHAANSLFSSLTVRKSS